MADSIIQPMRFTIDLDSALVTQTGCGQLIYGDKSANVIEVKVQRGGKAIDLTGMTATGAFYRPVDGAEVPLPGAISANVVGVQLIDECYEMEGHYEAEVKLSQGEVRRTILSIVGYVHRAGSGAVVNVTGVVPSIPELLAQISAMEAAAERANTAAARAEALAIDANGYAQNAKQLNGKSAEYYIQPPNLLDNSDFRSPVNQRGQTSYTEEGYTIDRWVLGSGTVTLVDDGLQLNEAALRQYVPLKAGTYTAVFTRNDEQVLFYAFTFDGQSTIENVGSNQNSAGYVTAYVYSTGVIAVQLVTTNISPVFIWAALYEGEYTADNLPPYVPKGYAAELAECMLYYRPEREYILCCYGDGYLFGYKFETRMRDGVNPTPIISNVYTATWGAVDGDTAIMEPDSGGFGYVSNSNFKKGEYYRINAAFSSDL